MFETLIPAAAGLLGGMGGGSDTPAAPAGPNAAGGRGGSIFGGDSIFGSTLTGGTTSGGAGGSAAQGGNAGAVSQTSWLTLAVVGLVAGALVGLVVWLVKRK